MTLIKNNNGSYNLPNKIQDFGYLIGVKKTDFKIDFVSENIINLFDQFESPLQLVNTDLKDLFQLKSSDADLLKLKEGESVKEFFKHKDKEYFVYIYANEDHIHIELEEAIILTERPSFHQNTEHLLYSNSKAENWKRLVDSVKELTGYSRVYVFKFVEDKSGIVIEEKADEGLKPFLGLYFPVNNIPEYHNGVYTKKRNRMISEIDSKAVNIVGNNLDKINLVYSEMRAATTEHANFLRNFNLVSSFTTSIVINGKLWGLLVCHNPTYKHISFDKRKQAEILTRLARVSYVNFKFEEQIKFQDRYQKILIKLKESLLINDSISDIPINLEDMLSCTKANGIAFVHNDNIHLLGETPVKQEIIAIKNWAFKNSIHDLFYSNSFYLDHHKELPISKNSSGIAFKFIDLEFNSFLIWFKKDQTIFPEWNAKSFDENFDLSKNDFNTWQNKLVNQANIWKEKELFIIREILNLILETNHVKTFKIRELYNQLQEINTELDSFSYTISHDLRTPLTVMKLNCQMLQQALKNDENNASKVKSIIGEIDRLANMMQEILQLSKAKKSELNLEEINSKELIQRIVSESIVYNNTSNTEIQIGELLPVYADKTMAYEIFLNVINNAIKYSSKHEKPKVEIHSFIEKDEIIYQIKDNGIGIKVEDRPKMFKLFSRMSNTTGFRGNGVGLSIVYRMMERLDGSISFESEENLGTTFTLRFKHK